jgi:hypothetical protein
MRGRFSSRKNAAPEIICTRISLRFEVCLEPGRSLTLLYVLRASFQEMPSAFVSRQAIHRQEC